MGGGGSVVRRQGVGSGDQPHVPLLGPRTLHTQHKPRASSHCIITHTVPSPHFQNQYILFVCLWVNDCDWCDQPPQCLHPYELQRSCSYDFPVWHHIHSPLCITTLLPEGSHAKGNLSPPTAPFFLSPPTPISSPFFYPCVAISSTDCLWFSFKLFNSLKDLKTSTMNKESELRAPNRCHLHNKRHNKQRPQSPTVTLPWHARLFQ